VVEGGEQLNRLLDGVLDLAKADPLRAKLDLTPVDMRGLARGVVRVWGAHARAIGVGLTLDDADPTLSYHVMADFARVEQTLVNLVSNALAAVSAGGKVEVRLAGSAKGEALRVLVEVVDTGPPIPADERAKIFEAWDQTQRGRLQGGTGLGLKICAQNMSLMGGQIAVDPRAGALGEAALGGENGAIFWFAFEAPIHRPAPRSQRRISETSVDQIRILAAEDNAANRRVLALALESAPVSLTFAEDGARALDLWRSAAFDLILMDVNMPVLGGREAVRAIRLEEPPGTRIPIWMLTANVFPEDVARYHEDGADGALRKPLEIARLYALLGEVVRLRLSDA
jgi:CheY-like chemotaxis protein/uncharacterized protein YfcZ (UPF0381/DUF406 family)